MPNIINPNKYELKQNNILVDQQKQKMLRAREYKLKYTSRKVYWESNLEMLLGKKFGDNYKECS